MTSFHGFNFTTKDNDPQPSIRQQLDDILGKNHTALSTGNQARFQVRSPYRRAAPIAFGAAALGH